MDHFNGQIENLELRCKLAFQLQLYSVQMGKKLERITSVKPPNSSSALPRDDTFKLINIA